MALPYSLPAFLLTPPVRVGNLNTAHQWSAQMTVLLVVLVTVFLFSLAGGAAMWVFLRGTPAPQPAVPAPDREAASASFRWRYVALPAAVLVLAIALVGYFGGRLPEEIAYHFRPDGSPDAWFSRSTAIVWTLLPQFCLAVLAAAVTWGIGRLGTVMSQDPASAARLDRLLLVMGNMVSIPQLILFFAMLDAFSYNSYQIHILPLWVFALIVMAVGAIVLVVFFYRIIRQRGPGPAGLEEEQH